MSYDQNRVFTVTLEAFSDGEWNQNWAIYNVLAETADQAAQLAEQHERSRPADLPEEEDVPIRMTEVKFACWVDVFPESEQKEAVA